MNNSAPLTRPVSLSGSKPSLLRHLNQQQILAALQSHGPLSRAEISRRTGVSFPTVTRAVASLVDARLLEESESESHRVGRPGRLVRLARSGVSVLGVVIGVETCEVAIAGLDGETLVNGVREFCTPQRYEDLIEKCADFADELARERSTSVLAMTASVPGLLNRREGRSLFSPNLHQLDGQRLGADLTARLKIPGQVIQESQALCLAEQAFGAARGLRDFAMMDISGGLGLGVMQRGEFVAGHSGLAGELGHVTVELNGRPCGCGNHGCLETVATDAALVNLMTEQTGHRWRIEELTAAVRSGELNAAAQLNSVLDYLSVAAAAVLNIFNPERLFIYGRLFDADEGLFNRWRERVQRRALAPNWKDCELVRAQGNKRLGAIASAISHATSASV